jgi:hypothetical protein
VGPEHGFSCRCLFYPLKCLSPLVVVGLEGMERLLLVPLLGAPEALRRLVLIYTLMVGVGAIKGRQLPVKGRRGEVAAAAVEQDNRQHLPALAWMGDYLVQGSGAGMFAHRRLYTT